MSCIVTSLDDYYIIMTEAQEATWLNRLLEELELRMPKPMTIYEDNKAAILFADHPGDH